MERSMRPQPVTAIGSRSNNVSAFSNTPCTVLRPGCTCQPEKGVPLYAISMKYLILILR